MKFTAYCYQYVRQTQLLKLCESIVVEFLYVTEVLTLSAFV